MGYERTWPVSSCSKDNKNGCVIEKSYQAPSHPVYIVNGAGGNIEGIDPSWQVEEKAPYRSYHDAGFHTGISRVEVNMTTLTWDFVYSGNDAIPHTNASNKGESGKIVDRFVITKK